MLDYTLLPEPVAARKAEIIARLGQTPHADDVIPASDRLLIAVMVMAGAMKMMQTLDSHLGMAIPAFSSPYSGEALMILLFQEAEIIASAVHKQMGELLMESMASTPRGFGMLVEAARGSPNIADAFERFLEGESE